MLKNYKYFLCVLGLLFSLSVMAEPSGRGVDIEATSLHEDLMLFLFGLGLLLIAGLCYLLKEKHKAIEVMTYIFGILGGFTAFGGGWSLLGKFILFPVLYVLQYAIFVIIYIGVVLLPYVIIYAIGTKITNMPLRILFYIILAALCVWGEYYCIIELEAIELFPEWRFMEAFYNNLYPVEE